MTWKTKKFFAFCFIEEFLSFDEAFLLAEIFL
jgi:hypothetical protein